MNIYDVTTEQVGQAYLTWLVAYRYQAACVKAFNRTQDEDDEHGKDAEYKDSLDKIGDLQRAMHVAGEAHRQLIELADLSAIAVKPPTLGGGYKATHTL